LASQFCQTVGDNFFSPPHIDLRVGKLHLLPNKKYKTVGVALICKLIELGSPMMNKS
jgi:hypothetical protein